MHTWLADTTEKATPGTSVLLVCVLDKIGTFGMLRFCLGLFPDASQWATPVVITLALISIVYGAFIAIGQDDILRLIGLTSLSHFGFITLGIFAFSSQGASGSILYMVNHGIGTAALFLLAGFLIKRSGTTLISEMRGRREDRAGARRAVPRRRAGHAGPARAEPVRLRDPGDHRRLRPRLVGRRDRRDRSIVLGRDLRCPAGCTSGTDRPGPSALRAVGHGGRSRRDLDTGARSGRDLGASRAIARWSWRWCSSASTRCRCST